MAPRRSWDFTDAPGEEGRLGPDRNYRRDAARGCDLRSVMGRMGHTLIQSTQKYLHALPDADQRNLDAFRCIAEPPTP